MDALETELVRWFDRLWRRMAAARLIESAAIGTLIACASGIILTAALAWRGGSSLGLVAILLPTGLVLGALAGWIRRPSRLQAVMEADRQLRLDDLLSTANAILESSARCAPDPAFSRVLLYSAQNHCRRVAPSEVLFHRFHLRVYAGTGLLILLTLSLALISGNPLIAQAARARQAEQQRLARQDPSNHPQRSAASDDSTLARRHRIDGESGSQTSDRSNAGGVTRTSETDSSGDRPAQSDARIQPRNLPDRTASAGTSDATRSGDGPAALRGAPGPSAGSQMLPSANFRQPPPWQSDDWIARQQEGLKRSESSDTPAEYRDLIRDYFTR